MRNAEVYRQLAASVVRHNPPGSFLFTMLLEDDSQLDDDNQVALVDVTDDMSIVGMVVTVPTDPMHDLWFVSENGCIFFRDVGLHPETSDLARSIEVYGFPVLYRSGEDAARAAYSAR